MVGEYPEFWTIDDVIVPQIGPKHPKYTKSIITSPEMAILGTLIIYHCNLNCEVTYQSFNYFCLYIKNINMFRKTFTSANNKKSISVFDSSVVVGFYMIQYNYNLIGVIF